MSAISQSGETVYTLDSKSSAERLAGSNPASGTKHPTPLQIKIDVSSLRDSVSRHDHLNEPHKWVSERLDEPLWSKQRDIFLSVRDHRRTAVHSCHSAGKSFVASRIAAHWIECHPPGEAFVVTTAPTFPQVRAILWQEINRAHAKGQLSGRTNQTEWWVTFPDGHEEMVAFGRKPEDLSPSAFQGIHKKYVLVIFDEACGIHENLWTAADSLISNEYSRFLAIGNPDDPATEFAEVCKPGSGWNVIGISAFDTPNFTDECVPESLRPLLISPTWQQEKLRKWGVDNPLYVSKVLGRFPEVSTDGLIPIAWIKAAQQRTLPPTTPIELGVDVGRGNDQSVIACRWGSHVRILSRDQIRDTMQTCGNVLRQLTATGATVAKVDEIGVGAGVVDRAREQDKPVEGVNVGRQAEDAEHFRNLRAEGYWRLRERFQDEAVDLDPTDEDLAAQLVALKYKVTSSGKIQMESKDEIRRKGGRSPDDADAVMLAFLPLDIASGGVFGVLWGQ